MPRFGRYETTRELHRGGLAVVFVVRDTEGGGEFAAKELQLGHGILAAGQAEALAAQFLKRAKVQQAAAKAGEHWAPVHGSGRSDDGAYYVTDLYPRSAQRLAAGRVKLDAMALRIVVESVVLGLKELQGVEARRGHGNLKLTNVLIVGGEDRGLERVVLADPTSGSAARQGVTARDLRALGEIIHELVLHQPVRARTGWPVSSSAAWTRLSPAGDEWLALCNRLLDPAMAENTPSLDEVLAEIAALPQKRGSRKGVLFGAVAGIAAIAAVGGGVLFLGKPPPEPEVVVEGEPFDEAAWTRLCLAYYQWFGGLVQTLDPKAGGAREAARRKLFSEDPYLGKVIATIGGDIWRLDPRLIGGSPDLERVAVQPTEQAQKGEAVRRTREALAVVERVEAIFAPEGLAAWALWADADRLAASCAGREWFGAAEHLRALAAGIRPSHDLIDQVEALMGASDFVRTMDRLDQAVARSETLDPPDPVLLTLGATVAEVARATSSPPARRTVDMVRDLMTLEEMVRPLVSVMSDEWDLLDRDLFAQSAAHVAFQEDPRPRQELLSLWLAEARSPRYRLLTEPDPREQERWEQTGEQVLAGITRLTEEFELEAVQGPAEFGARLARIEGEVETLSRLRWNTVNRAEISQGSRRVRDDLARLTVDVSNAVQAQVAFANQSLEEVRRQLAAMENIAPSGSAVIDGAWRAGRDVILATETNVNGLRDRSGALQNLLRGLDVLAPAADDGLDPPPGKVREWRAGVLEAAARQREQVLDAAVAGVDWTEGVPATLEPPAQALAEFAEWREVAQRMMADMAQVEDRLEGLYPLAQRIESGAASAQELLERWASQEVFMEEAVQMALAPVLGPVEELRRLEASSDRTVLLSAAAEVGHAPRAMTAWRRLGDRSLIGPAVRQSLDDESRLQRMLEGVAGSAPEARRAAIRQELAEQARQRWAAHVELLATEADLGAAMALREPLRGDEGDLSARARFNIALYGLRLAQQDETMEEEQLRERIEGFRATVVQMTELAQLEPVGALLAALGELTSEAPEEPPVDITTLGPGDPGIGWQGEASPDGQQVTFRRRFGVPYNVEQTLVFVRVEPSTEGASAAFVSTQEATLGLFTTLIGTAGLWEEITPLLPRWDLAFGVDSRRGPRVWDWATGRAAAQRPMVPARAWLADNPDVQPRGVAAPYPSAPGFPPPVPSLDHPMQYVSPGAAVIMARLLNCRLPSTTEWEAALEIEAEGRSFEDYIASRTPNLRDEIWAQQKRHVDGLIQSGALGVTNDIQPSDGSFWRQDLTSHRAGYSDGALWPLPAGQPRGRLFQHLIGNVAELVYDEPAVLEGIPAPPDRAAVAQVRAALAREGQLGLIGGSAQSPPGVNPLVRQAFAGASEGYSDVGIRLAFTAGAGAPLIESMAVRLGRTLEPSLFLAPPARGPDS